MDITQVSERGRSKCGRSNAKFDNDNRANIAPEERNYKHETCKRSLIKANVGCES